MKRRKVIFAILVIGLAVMSGCQNREKADAGEKAESQEKTVESQGEIVSSQGETVPEVTKEPEAVNNTEDKFSESIEAAEFVISDGVLTAYNGTEETVYVPDGVISIPDSCVWPECVKNIVIPWSVEDIGQWYDIGKYENIENVTQLYPENIADEFRIVGRRLYAYTGNESAVTIPEGVNAIGSYCRWSDSVTSIELPDTVTYIDEYAFSDCKNLEKVVISGTVNATGYAAFEDCTKLSEVVLPDTIEKISTRSFYNCSTIKFIKLPEAVTVIDEYAFAECTSLESVYIPAGVKEINADAFKNTGSITIYGEAGSYAEAYAKENNINFEVIEADSKVNVRSEF